MTNFERIKSMSVYELAIFLGCIREDADENIRIIDGQMVFDSIEAIEEWLEGEHKEDDT